MDRFFACSASAKTSPRKPFRSSFAAYKSTSADSPLNRQLLKKVDSVASPLRQSHSAGNGGGGSLALSPISPSSRNSSANQTGVSSLDHSKSQQKRQYSLIASTALREDGENMAPPTTTSNHIRDNFMGNAQGEFVLSISDKQIYKFMSEYLRL